jgi:hypothetical protein
MLGELVSDHIKLCQVCKHDEEQQDVQNLEAISYRPLLP